MTLALAFGRADVGRFLTELSVDEFRLWQDYYLRHSLGEQRADARQLALLSQLARLIGGMFGGDGDSEESPNDLLPNYPYFQTVDREAASMVTLDATKLAMMRTAGFLQLPGDERRLIIAKAKEELASRSLAAGRRVGAAEILNEERKG